MNWNNVVGCNPFSYEYFYSKLGNPNTIRFNLGSLDNHNSFPDISAFKNPQQNVKITA